MGKHVETDGFAFEFADTVIDAFVFDGSSQHVEQSHLNPVDIIAEFPDGDLFIELKKFEGGNVQFKCPLWGNKIVPACPLNDNDEKRSQATINRLAKEIKDKYLHSLLHRQAQGLTGNRKRYCVVVEGLGKGDIDNLNAKIKSQLPLFKRLPESFSQSIVDAFAVVDTKQWNTFEWLSKYGSCRIV